MVIRLAGRIVWVWSCLLVLLVAGCDGCRRGLNAPPANPPPASPLEDFTSLPPRTFPSDRNASQNGVKPGHWFAASQSLRSNKSDARGELQSEVRILTRRGVNSTANTSDDEANRRSLSSDRPVVLPKSQMRRFDVRLLAPRMGSSVGQQFQLSSRFVTSGRTAYVDTAVQNCSTMAPEEYFIVVLTKSPEQFTRLQTSDWVRPFRDPYSSAPDAVHYRLTFPSDEGLLPLSSTMLDWTQTSVVIWDDLHADSLTPNQIQAIGDWVHLGGRLVVNGSDATDSLITSSLARWLPIESTGNIELDIDSATKMLETWTVSGDDSTQKQIALVRDSSSRVAVGGDRRIGAVAVGGTDELVIVRPLGRGVICQSRFNLTSGWLANWKSFDSFFNAAILGRPARKFVPTDTFVRDESIDVSDKGFPIVVQKFKDERYQESELPAINSSLRLLSRDAVLPVTVNSNAELAQLDDDAKTAVATIADSFVDPTVTSLDSKPQTTGIQTMLTRIDPVAGVSGWNDESDVMQQLRSVLRSESGIEIPKSSLVVRSLGVYLLLLVPVNYLVFRLWGRLEYAWLAAPVIAVAGAVWVAREAQLDIGFARSQTELALLELPADYSRGHLTRAVAIYNSLSTRYDISFNHQDAVAAPVDVLSRGSEANHPVFETSTGDGPRLRDVNIGSNQVRMLHTEEIIEIGGVIRREGNFLVNETAYDLTDVFVVERSTNDLAKVAVVANCPAGGRVGLRFRDTNELTISDEMPMQTKSLVSRLVAKGALEVGSSRVVARIDAMLPGMEIIPQTSQRTGQTVLVAHLSYASGIDAGFSTQATPDANLVSALLKDRPKDIENPDVLIRDEP